MKLHVITAVTRPENLTILAQSLAVAAFNTDGSVDVQWHWRFDLDREHVGGQAVKNAMLDEIRDGWVWALDDDTVAHPDMLAAILQAHDDGCRGLVVSQARADGRTLVAAPENVRVGGIDVGQAVLSRHMIGNRRLPKNYEGDGHWLQAVLQNARKVRYLNEILSYHNALEARPDLAAAGRG